MNWACNLKPCTAALSHDELLAGGRGGSPPARSALARATRKAHRRSGRGPTPPGGVGYFKEIVRTADWPGPRPATYRPGRRRSGFVGQGHGPNRLRRGC